MCKTCFAAIDQPAPTYQSAYLNLVSVGLASRLCSLTANQQKSLCSNERLVGVLQVLPC